MSAHYTVQNARQDIAVWNKPDPATYQKIAFLMGHCLLTPGARIADMGCGWGEGSFHLARMNPQVQVVGVDIDPRRIASAQSKFGGLPNLSYEVGDIEQAHLMRGPFDAFLNSSVMHHVFSYNLYDEASVQRAMENQYAALKPGGLLVIRDFPAAPADRRVHLSVRHDRKDLSLKGRSGADMLDLFSKIAARLLPVRQRGFDMEEIAPDMQGWRRFSLPAYWAWEFAWRMNYRASFLNEAQERYSFWTHENWRQQAQTLGARVLFSGPYSNPWIIENWFKGHLRLTSEEGAALPLPPTNFVMLLQKTAKGESLYLNEQSGSHAPKTYLARRSYRSKQDGTRFDTASRPGEVRDYLPFVQSGQTLTVWAKCGYPRPLLNAQARASANLDGSFWSGHVIEPVALANIGAGANETAMLAAKLATSAFGAPQSALTYYPCIGLSEERVTSTFLPYPAAAPRAPVRVDPAVSGYTTSGDIRAFDAQVLLRAAHVGVLPESRLELNIYALLRALGLTPDSWMHGSVPSPQPSAFQAASLEALLARPARQVFTSATQGDYICHERALFAEHSAGGVLRTHEHEFIYPKHASTNLAVLHPLARDADGHVCLGLFETDTPALQKHEGNSRTLTAPHMRLPFSVGSIDAACEWLGKNWGAPAAAFKKLGEGSFASIGMTREKCYHFMVNTPPQNAPLPLHYVRLDDVFAHLESFRDASLMVGALRTLHALGLWKQGAERLKARKNACASKGPAVKCSL